MWNRLRRITAPPALPVTLAEAKAHLRVDHADEDTLISTYVDAATAHVEGPHGIGIALVEQQWELTLDGFPTVIYLPIYPVLSVDAVEYIDGDGVTQTVASFQSDTASNPARITPDDGASWPPPKRVLNAVTIRFTTGYAPDGLNYQANIPQDLKNAIQLLVGHWYEHREAVGTATAEMPLAVESILSRYRVLA
jgi:uncharacterized phiE125 gp8 family phage protein